MDKKQTAELVDPTGHALIQPVSVGITPMQLLANAQAAGASIEQMQQLMDLQDRFEAKEARKAYNKAIAAFRAEGIKIIKGKHVKFGTTEYDHATLGNVVEQIVPAMAKHGISHDWKIDQDGQGAIKVTCRISHVDGHSETVTLQADPDTSGGKNKIQQIASTVTYLQRYTLLAGTGLATHDQDDDARTSGATDPVIDDDQLANIDALLMETGSDPDKFCVFMRVGALTEIKQKDYAAAIKALEAKRKGGK
jgi:hypothetical protein